MQKKVLALVYLILSTYLFSAVKQTVGVFVNDSASFKGYTLFSPAYWYETYLINNEGRKIRSWESDHIPGLGGVAYLSDDGYLYRSMYTGQHPVLNGGGATGGIQKFDWDGNMVWNFEYSGDKYLSHHDIEILPSGNVLMIAWEIKSNTEAILAGADISKLHGLSLYPDYVIEVEPVGADSGNIVWQWHAWDHLVQDYDSMVNNYGKVADHPERIDLNARNVFTSDFIHLNSVKYNKELDQIILTTPFYNEVWVIDHSTTTQEAKGHTGGRYGRGGDLLYRWGNPAYYDRGYSYDQKIFGGHDANWIEPGCPGEGNIIFFNNGSVQSGRPYSSLDEFKPPVDEEGNYIGKQPWGPTGLAWTYTAPIPGDFFVPYICGAQRLPNGNTLACKGPSGEFFEVTPEGDIVWRYIDPVTDSGPVWQGDSVYSNSVFKIRRYAPDYPAFAGRSMAPGKHVELYPDDTVPGVSEQARDKEIQLTLSSYFLRNNVEISYELGLEGNASIKIYNAAGQVVRSLVDGPKTQDCYKVVWDGTDDRGHHLSSGVYFIRFETEKASLRERVVLVR